MESSVEHDQVVQLFCCTLVGTDTCTIALVHPGASSTAAELAAGAATAATRKLPRSATGNVSEGDIIKYINEQIRKGWADTGVGPSPQATDAEWCRRVYLDIIGRLPTVEELNAYLSSGSPEKRLRMVSLLTGETLPGKTQGHKPWPTSIWKSTPVTGLRSFRFCSSAVRRLNVRTVSS
ncbi:MAG: DUF1549 domain-containing protein [Pirellulales bacterium]